jgi:hypothetical protein
MRSSLAQCEDLMGAAHALVMSRSEDVMGAASALIEMAQVSHAADLDTHEAVSDAARAKLAEAPVPELSPRAARSHTAAPIASQYRVDIDTSLPTHTNIPQDSAPSSRTPAQLDALLKPPPRPAKAPWYVAGLKALSYFQSGSRPKKGLAEELVTKMEKAHEKEGKEGKEWEDEMDEMDEMDFD